MPDSFQVLVRDLHSGLPRRRAQAAEALGGLGDPRAIGHLVGLLVRMEGAHALGAGAVREAAVRALAQLAEPNAAGQLLLAAYVGDHNSRWMATDLIASLLASADDVCQPIFILDRVLSLPQDDVLARVTNAAEGALSRLGAPLAGPVIRALKQQQPQQRLLYWCRRALSDARLPANTYPNPLRFLAEDAGIAHALSLAARRWLFDRRPPIRAQVIAGWVREAPAAVEPLWRLVLRPELQARLWAAEAIGRIGGPETAGRLRPLLAGEDSDLALCAAVALGCMRERAAVPTLVAALRHEDSEARLASAGALRRAGAAASPAIAPLRECLAKERDREVRSACEEALRAITTALRTVPAELEASPPPAGRGTELEAGPPEAGPPGEPPV